MVAVGGSFSSTETETRRAGRWSGTEGMHETVALVGTPNERGMTRLRQGLTQNWTSSNLSDWTTWALDTLRSTEIKKELPIGSGASAERLVLEQ